jgi:hypothetical protein
MKKLMKQVLDELKDKVLNNLNTVRANEKVIREALSMTDNSSKTRLLNEKFEQNRGLLNQNLDYLEIQRRIVKLIDKFRPENAGDTESKQLLIEASQYVDIDFWALTLDGSIPFNELHPMVKNEDFYQKLIDYYVEREEYEKCADIKMAFDSV